MTESYYEGRHPGTVHMMKILEPNLNLRAPQLEISQACGRLAFAMFTRLPDGPELTTGLRKLLEAKDCFVRASLDFS